MEPATKRGFAVVENSSAALRAICAASTFNSCVSDCAPELGQHDRRALKTIGFDDIGAGFEIGAMNRLDPFGMRRIQIFAAIFEAAKSSRVGLYACSMVPIAPSMMRMREARAS